jgi:hypothetical protein
MKTRTIETVPNRDVTPRTAPVLIADTFLCSLSHVTRTTVTGVREAGHLGFYQLIISAYTICSVFVNPPISINKSTILQIFQKDYWCTILPSS